MAKKLYTCRRCDGTGDEPGAPERPEERALCIECEGKKKLPKRKAILQLAKELHHDEGTCEVDDNAKLSEGDDNGCYVQAWVWVDYSDTELDKWDD